MCRWTWWDSADALTRLLSCAGEAEDAGPPYALLEHTPLAVLTNGLLAALNELRHCAPLSLAAPVAQTLQVRGFALLASVWESPGLAGFQYRKSLPLRWCQPGRRRG